MSSPYNLLPMTYYLLKLYGLYWRGTCRRELQPQIGNENESKL